MNERQANLFVIGSMRSGTTSTAQLLSKHPDIYFSPVKEPHFFVDRLPSTYIDHSQIISPANYFKNVFPNKLHTIQLETSNQYKKLFSQHKNEKYLAEGSTSYLHSPSAARDIYKYNPDAKIIIILRDPLLRSYSHYKMNKGLGREISSFYNAIKTDIANYNKANQDVYSYLNMSCYDAAVNRFKEFFGNIHIIRLEDLVVNETIELNRLSSFLDIESFSDPLPHLNKSALLKHNWIIYLLRLSRLKKLISKIFTTSSKGKIYQKIKREHTDEIPISPDLREYLDLFFKEESSIYYQ